MGVTIKHFFGKKETFCYPEEKLPMAEGFRGGDLTMDWRVCIGCQMCAMACPNKALDLTVVTDAKKKRHMKYYIHKTGRCLFCNLCVEVCPVHTLQWDKNYANSTWNKEDMVHDAMTDKDRADLDIFLSDVEKKAKAEAEAKAKAEAEAKAKAEAEAAEGKPETPKAETKAAPPKPEAKAEAAKKPAAQNAAPDAEKKAAAAEKKKGGEA